MAHNSDVIGVGAKVTVQPSRYMTFSINDTYDNYQHNILMLGAQVRLNDLFNKSNLPINEQDLSTRLLDPIDRNYAAAGNGDSSMTHRGDQTYDLGRGLYTSNGIFFSDNGSGYTSPNAAEYAPGTYGNPYTEEEDIATYGMQAIFDDIRNDFTGQVYMYFAPGNYTAYTQTENGYDEIYLADGMSIYGRDYWYTTPTSGEQRAAFNGSLILDGNNTLDSMRVYNVLLSEQELVEAEDTFGYFDVGIKVETGDNVKINNVEVGSIGNDEQPITAYATGIAMDSSMVTISNSNIYGYQYGAAAANGQINAIGIEMTNGGILTVANSKIYGEAKETSGLRDYSGNGYGIRADGKQETIIIENGSEVFGQGTMASTGDMYYSCNGYGILIGADQYNNQSGDYSIHGNNITISGGSEVFGQGTITSSDDSKFSGNGYGILIGADQYNNNQSGDYSIYDNNITISGGNEVLGQGNITSSDNPSFSGNGYGILIGATQYYNNNGDYSIHGNNITISGGSEVFGQGTITSDDDPNFSGNGYGILIGADQYHSNQSGYYSIHDNNITISGGNEVLGQGTITSSDDPGFSGNGYGILIGSNQYYNNNGDYSIHGNNITISGGNEVLGQGAAGTGYISFSGNGYGILIGSNQYYYNNGDYSIHDNNITISGGNEILGYGTATGSDEDMLFTGNGYGILIGAQQYNRDKSGGNYSIHDNNITIFGGSEVLGQGTVAGTGDIYFSGNGYGILIGANQYYNNNIGDYSIHDNYLEVTNGSSVIGSGNVASGNNSGSGYGILIGSDSLSSTGISNYNIYGNEVYISLSTIAASSLGAIGSAQGINIGQNGNYYISLAQNILTFANSAIILNASGRDAYGISMLAGSVTLNIDSTANIIRTDAGTNGGKIVLSDGTIIVVW